VHTLFGPYSSPPPLLLGRNCSALFSNFVEDISNNKTKRFASWGKDSYTERFLALLPCKSILQPELIHLYLTFSLVPDHLPILTSVALRHYGISSSAVGTSNTFKFWVSYLSPFLLYVLSPCHVTQVQQHCCIWPGSKVHIWGRT
jgi:hypothetical protein